MLAIKCQGKHNENIHWLTCKRDNDVQDQEIKKFDIKSETVSRVIETETTSLTSLPTRDVS